eukprot:CAMPEP_0182544134 /NCGR_PEP_ID=MMETSP1323-20130603/32693_1 /TAXON_ID=236787 /ORGANISM="Florenciella parvula, Strain RCC1693" /LENGTH=49 /DNA_ID= /DNA_START= /DNA_END= /DNA_ORIENTATION=
MSHNFRSPLPLHTLGCKNSTKKGGDPGMTLAVRLSSMPWCLKYSSAIAA